MTTLPGYIDVVQAATIVGCHPNTVNRWCQEGTLKDIGYTNLDQIPLGYIVGIVELDGVHKTEYVYPLISDDEREFGNYASGRFAWHLSSAKLLPAVPYRGKQGLFDVDTSEIVRLLNPLVCENQG